MARSPSLPLLVAIVMTSAAFGGDAKAQAVDLMRASCADFVGMNANDQSQITLWLAGYYAGGAQRALLDVAKIQAAPADLLAVCAKGPQLPLIGAETRAVFMPPAP